MENNYKKLLTIQDISCVGQCSTTVAQPIISALGIETCILPTAILSNHTAKDFAGFTFHDLTGEFNGIIEKWINSNIKYDCVYTGYLGRSEQIGIILNNLPKILKKDAPFIVDPAMADNGKLYVGFDENYVDSMKKLCKKSDIILPNITEACLLCDEEYKEKFTSKFLKDLCNKISTIYKNALIVITGVPTGKNKLSIPVYKNGEKIYCYTHKKLNASYHGTGDIFSSVFSGVYIKTNDLNKAIKMASTFTYNSIKKAMEMKDHKYGVPFELCLKFLTKNI